jgi:hypothetical protein
MGIKIIDLLNKRCHHPTRYFQVSIKSGEMWNYHNYDSPWFVDRMENQWRLREGGYKPLYYANRPFNNEKELKLLLKEYRLIFDMKKFKDKLLYHILKEY